MSLQFLVLDDQDRVFTIHADQAPGKSTFVDYLVAAAGINVKQVLGSVPDPHAGEQDSLLAAPRTNMQEVAGVVQMTEKVLKNNLTPSKRPRPEACFLELKCKRLSEMSK